MFDKQAYQVGLSTKKKKNNWITPALGISGALAGGLGLAVLANRVSNENKSAIGNTEAVTSTQPVVTNQSETPQKADPAFDQLYEDFNLVQDEKGRFVPSMDAAQANKATYGGALTHMFGREATNAGRTFNKYKPYLDMAAEGANIGNNVGAGAWLTFKTPYIKNIPGIAKAAPFIAKTVSSLPIVPIVAVNNMITGADIFSQNYLTENSPLPKEVAPYVNTALLTGTSINPGLGMLANSGVTLMDSAVKSYLATQLKELRGADYIDALMDLGIAASKEHNPEKLEAIKQMIGDYDSRNFEDNYGSWNKVKDWFYSRQPEYKPSINNTSRMKLLQTWAEETRKAGSN